MPGPTEKNRVYYTGASSCGNCKLYPTGGDKDTRPDCCDKYKCAWLLGHGEEDDRPDKSLMVFDAVRGIENVVEARPLSEGIESTPHGRELADRISVSTGKPVIVFNFCEHRMVRVVGGPVSNDK